MPASPARALNAMGCWRRGGSADWRPSASYSQLEALSTEEQRLAQAVNALIAERSQWKEQQQADQRKRAELEAQQQDLQARFGERRRARDEAEAQLSLQRQALQQKEWELQRLGEELLALAEEERSSAQRL